MRFPTCPSYYKLSSDALYQTFDFFKRFRLISIQAPISRDMILLTCTYFFQRYAPLSRKRTRDILDCMYFDSHAHLTCDRTFHQITALLSRAKKARVDQIINVCTDQDSLARGLVLAEDVKGIYTVGATPPQDVQERGEIDFHLFEQAAQRGRLVAIGETGLDYHHQHAPKMLQKTFLIRYFQLAREAQLPVVIHCRSAFKDLFKIADEQLEKEAILLHCFTGNLHEAKEALARGWWISFSGIITFKKEEDLRRVVQDVPIEKLLIETDTPYLAPQSKRGKLNEPSFLIETAETVARIKNLSLEEIALHTRANTRHFFRIESESSVR